MTELSLTMEHISKAFGKVVALSDVTFTAKGGQVHVLCGENGAGKSTLMKILSGVHKADSGHIILNGRPRHFRNPSDALEAGISMLYQELDLAEDLSVYQNIFLGRELMKGLSLDDEGMCQQCSELLKRYGFNLAPRAAIRDLSMGECQIVELLKAIMRKSTVVVMDEPTSSLSSAETQILFRIIRQMRDEGMVIIYISHRMEEIMELADVISILRDGCIVHTAPVGALTVQEIVKWMVGRDVKEYYPPRTVPIGDVLFEAKNLSGPNGVHDVSFQVRRGEILGFSGLVGAGRSETADLIFGVTPKTSGVLLLHGKELDIRRPGDAIDAGIAYLTEDRKRTGLCVELPGGWNLTLPNLKRIGMGFMLDTSREEQICLKFAEHVRLHWASPAAEASQLSGGNQQKILIARWLLAQSDFLIFDEPTRGIDVGAKYEIYTLLNSLAAQGHGILVISSDLPEILGICDRICVMRGGCIQGTFCKADATPAKIMELAAISGEQP